MRILIAFYLGGAAHAAVEVLSDNTMRLGPKVAYVALWFRPKAVYEALASLVRRRRA